MRGRTDWAMFRSQCVFCSIVDERSSSTIIVASSDDGIVIVPKNPVTDGHVLVIPREHVCDFTQSPDITGKIMTFAAEVSRFIDADCNLITSRGTDATQTVSHMHVHLVPRRSGDDLSLPWTKK